MAVECKLPAPEPGRSRDGCGMWEEKGEQQGRNLQGKKKIKEKVTTQEIRPKKITNFECRLLAWSLGRASSP